jgi:hypothetical protein
MADDHRYGLVVWTTIRSVGRTGAILLVGNVTIANLRMHALVYLVASRRRRPA